MKRNLLIIGLLIIVVLFNSQMDVIKYIPSKAWFTGWWIESNWQQPAWQKYLLGWTVDGWHFSKMVMLTSFMSAIVISNKWKWYWVVVLLFVWGMLFNLFYIL